MSEISQPLRPAAFFDLDKTLIAGSSAFYWARAAASSGLISRRSLAVDAWENAKFRLRGSTDEAVEQVWERAGRMIAGQNESHFRRLAPQVLIGILPRLYPEIIRIAWDHQEAGRPVYIATASTQDTADMVASVLGLDGAVGAPLEVVDGVYTGRLAGPMTYREGKLDAIKALAERDGLDLSQSWAYTDSESDLPMLNAVGNPVVVNPDRELADVAEQKSWPVIRTEKIETHLRNGLALAVLGAAGALGRSVATLRGDDD